MGEPFRSTDHLSGAEHWFAQADTNADRRLSKDEFRSDALRFFATLDVDHDGELDPTEVDRYENNIAPEVTVRSYTPAVVKQDPDGNVVEAPYPTRQGAARYGFLGMPEPVIYADLNFDRSVTRAEFVTAADQRFRMLDTNGDGVITRSDLPALPHEK